MPTTNGELTVDAHTHIFCWGEDPAMGFVSHKARNAWYARFLLRWIGVTGEPGATITTKFRNLLLRNLHASSLDYIIVLAQDAVYHSDGTRHDSATNFYVSNDYVLDLARHEPRIIAGCSINPHRTDALAELQRCYDLGTRLVKIHTSIQGVDPALPAFDPFYRLAADLGVLLMFHTGYEHVGTVVSQQFADPAKLTRVLDHGGNVVAAHCGTCAWFDREDFYPNFIRMLSRHPNLYGDTAIMASVIRWSALKRLEQESEALKSRIVHGSDYPFPPSRLPRLLRAGLLPPQRKNALEMDLKIKRGYQFGPGYENLILALMGLQLPSKAPN